MGNNYKSMEKKKRITLVEALELYVPGGWKFTSCHCKKNCSLSNTCKYKMLSKPCNTHCHGGDFVFFLMSNAFLCGKDVREEGKIRSDLKNCNVSWSL